jgi:hypothetical protein
MKIGMEKAIPILLPDSNATRKNWFILSQMHVEALN